MDEKQVLQRRIKLNGQALKLIRVEREELSQRFSLFRIRENLLNRTGQELDPTLSQKLDFIDFLLRG